MDFTLTAYMIGLLSSVVTEGLKLVPFLNKNEITRSLTALVVMTFGTLWAIGFNTAVWDWNLFAQVVVWALVNYKMIVQPVATSAQLTTQK